MPEGASRKRAPDGKGAAAAAASKRAKRPAASAARGESVAPNATTAKLRFPIPPVLRKQLVDDWEYVTKDKMLISLPRKLTVSTVLEEFCQSKAKGGAIHPSWREVADGVRGYFNEAVQAVLLYRPEMDQLESLQRKGKLPAELADLYGPEHLLRLFVKLPGLLNKPNLDADSAKFIETKVTSLVKFLAKKADVYFEPAVYTTSG